MSKLKYVDTKQILSTFLKLGASAAMLGYLGWSAANDPQFRVLIAGPKQWSLLVLALPLCLAAVTLTILRWHMLVRTLGMEFRARDALRAGFLAYMVNLLPLGLVGGDSLKAVMLIQRQPKRKTEAIATVIVDRVIGLFALLLLAAVASLFCEAGLPGLIESSDRMRSLVGGSCVDSFSIVARGRGSESFQRFRIAADPRVALPAAEFTS